MALNARSVTSFSARASAFLDPPRFAVVATLNADGSPLQAVVWYVRDGDSVVFNSALPRHWPCNLLRDRRVSFTVADAYEYIQLRGVVEVDEDQDRAQAEIARLVRRYQPDEEIATAQIEGFRREHRVTFRLRPTHVFERL